MPNWVYAGLCQGCGEVVEAVLGEWPNEIGQMAMEGLIVVRQEGPISAGKGCFCPVGFVEDPADERG